jgi:FMN phosphatase YigB (HAD superfamily)
MIKAILFDMVGVLVFKKENYVEKTKDEIITENIEKLFNHLDDNKLIKDVKEKLKLTDPEIEKAAKIMPERFECFDDSWKLLPELKKKYKLAVVNNGNAIAKKYWDKEIWF